MRLVCVFCILMLLLYWIQNLTHDNWAWLGFIKPFLDFLLTEANKIYSVSFDLWGAVFEFKYLSALIILLIAAFIFKGLGFVIVTLENLYRGTRMLCKKTEETLFNKKLDNRQKEEQLKLTKYSVSIKTKIKKKFSHENIGVDIDLQNKLMNDFIKEKTTVSHMVLNGSFVYQFYDFEKIDTVLDVLFKVIKSSAPLDYAICIQVGNDLNQLGKLMELENFDKITIAADTAYRYRFNPFHRYQIVPVGEFQCGENSLEVHEFKEIL